LKQISVLSDNLINKIAAGEVVERPSSVVKELVENSLDAGSTQIKVEIEMGGQKLIKVTDNGDGISREFLPVALKRHATSKLSTLSELETLSSLGFRGEALPSIASVSLFEITSKTKDQISGYKIRIEEGKVVESSEVGSPDGTVIEVRELFYNTPARRKFLKTQVTETRHIINALNGLVLAFPSCAFELVSDGRSLINFNIAGNYEERVADLLGHNDFGRMLSFSEQTENLHVYGHTIKPGFARKNRAQVYFFVNRRRINSPLLYSALIKAHGEFLPHGRYPLTVLYIDIDSSLVDVNVSPTKSEVRFSDERSIFHVVMQTVRKCLSRDEVIPMLSPSESQVSSGETSSAENYRERIKQAAAKFFETHSSKIPDNQTSFNVQGRSRTAPLEEIAPLTSKPVFRVPSHTRVPEGKFKPKIDIDSFHRIEQFADLFIVAFSNDRITIIDQHAAHERILYEKALDSFENQKMVAQKLLMPINVEMEPLMLSAAEDYFELLASLGFELERFGPRSIAIYAIPAVTSGKNPENLIKDILSDLVDFGSEAEDRFKLAAQRFACRAAIKAGDRLSEEMMRGLVKTLFEAKNPYICPHGRPTIIRFSVEELKTRFGR